MTGVMTEIDGMIEIDVIMTEGMTAIMTEEEEEAAAVDCAEVDLMIIVMVVRDVEVDCVEVVLVVGGEIMTEEMIETKVVILDLAIQDSVVIIIELMTVVLVVVAVVA